MAYNLEMLMLWTDKSLRMTFGIASTLGVVLGSFAYAIATKQFRWEGFASLEDLRTQLVGAVLMGFGVSQQLAARLGRACLACPRWRWVLSSRWPASWGAQ